MPDTMDNVLNLKTDTDTDREEMSSAERRRAILAQSEAMEADEDARQKELIRKTRERNQRKEVAGNEEYLEPVSQTTPLTTVQSKSPTQPRVNNELSFGTVFLMIGTALLFDTLQTLSDLIVFDLGTIGVMITFFAFMTFWFWFRTKGIKFNKPSRALTFGGATIIEMIPFLNALPAWTLAVTLLVIQTNGEKYAKFAPLAEKAVEAYKKISPGGGK